MTLIVTSPPALTIPTTGAAPVIDTARDVPVLGSLTVMTGAPAGDAMLVFPAAVTIHGHTVVHLEAGDTLVPSSNTTAAHSTQEVMLALTAADAGQPVTVQSTGAITEPSWSWVDGPVWLGVNGQLTQVMPTADAGAAFLLQVGVGQGQMLFLSPQPPILLA